LVVVTGILGLGAATAVAAPDAAPIACDATHGVHVIVVVDYDRVGLNRDLNAAKLVVSYPTTVRLPGTGAVPEVRDRVQVLGAGSGDVRAVPGVFGTDAAPRLNVVLASFADTPNDVGDGIAPGDVLDVHFDCAGTGLPADTDVTCRVESANDIMSNPLDVKCSTRVMR
jgi:hypothetical protein